MGDRDEAVIFDNGSGLCKAGVAGENIPRVIIPTVVGRVRATAVMLGFGHKGYYIGDEAQAKRGILSLNYPMEHGIVTSWEDMEKIWRHLYQQELKLKAYKSPVMLTEAPLNPHANREKMAEIMFEVFSVPAMFVALQAILSLYALGQTTGIVLDSGDGVTHTVPIYEGHCLPQGVCRMNFAGRDITKYFAMLLMESGYYFVSTAEREVVKDIKEKLCYVAMDINIENMKSPKEILRQYILPDGNVIKIGDQLYRAPEALFTPINAGNTAMGIHQMILESIRKCDMDIHKYLFGNMVLAGGSTLFHGLDKRVLKEVQLLAPRTMTLKIMALPERIFSGWIGASILSSLPTFKPMWVTVNDYKEYGPAAIHQKCF
ncbi:actin-85C-like [Microcaecilia unicolor]|uniref:Actin-85C-like n=1 Tax=Microcaecilia unicolor TaxID=1415580 RepID=A0A6P7ZDJ1_9AMPH|nr:actin-85C-like [Microcaecilia unicolor]